jgi:hypothetical protein
MHFSFGRLHQTTIISPSASAGLRPQISFLISVKPVQLLKPQESLLLEV